MEIRIVSALRIWHLASVAFGCSWMVYTLFSQSLPASTALGTLICSVIQSSPVLVALVVALPVISRLYSNRQEKAPDLILVCSLLCCCCGMFSGFSLILESGSGYTTGTIASISNLLASSFIALVISSRQLAFFFGNSLIHTKQLLKHGNDDHATRRPELFETHAF